MGRRSDHTREELQYLAVKAAIELLDSEGAEGFSARKVAAKIGYTVGTLYNVFGSYDNMLLQVHARTLDEWFAFLDSRLKRRGKADPLHVLAKGYVDFARAHQNRWFAMFEHVWKDGVVPEWYNEKATRPLVATEAIILPRVGNDRRKARRAAHVLWAGIHGLCVLSLSRKLDLVESETLETLTHALIDNYLKGQVARK